MHPDDENFAVKITDDAKGHEEWLAIMRFGLGTLLKNQPLLMELIVREAERESKKNVAGHHLPSDEARHIMLELRLHFEVTPLERVKVNQ